MKKADGPRASATETRSILEMLSESPSISTADDLVSNLHMIETCSANICRIAQATVAPAKESDNSTHLGINKTLTTKSEREERADKNLKDLERARKWHKDNIDHKNNADLDTKLIAKLSEKIISLEAELCKARERKIMAKRNASNEMYGGMNQKLQSTSYAAPTASLAKGGPSTPASLMANSNKRKSNTDTLVSAVHDNALQVA